MAAPLFSINDYVGSMQALMPRGRVWQKEPDSTQAKVLTAFSYEFQRTNADANGMLIDSFPSSATNLLEEWEQTLGLPDPCSGEGPTIAIRRKSVVAKLIASGGQSPKYFINVATALGYDITITQFAPFRFGMIFGSPFFGIDWAFAWQVNAPQITESRFQFGVSAFGEPFVTWGNTVLQCVLQSLSPAHTIVIFSYS